MAAVHPPPHISVAVFLTRFEPGGTERQMIELIRRLDRGRFTVHAACFQRAGAWLGRAAGYAASIVEFPITSFAAPATLGSMLAFARWCRRQHIDVVQTCDLYANIFALPAAALAGVPARIGSRRELNPDKTARQIWLQRQAYRWATKVVANSSAARAALEREGIAPESIAVIANGVDGAAFSERTSRGAGGRPRTVITVANLRAEKDHEALIAAAADLVADHPDLQFQIVGDGPRRGALETLVRERDLESHVRFLGHREDVPSLLSRADVFVLPSRSEAFPNSVIEAMASGLPVVATATGGLLDLVDNGRTGILVAPGDARGLAGAVRRLLGDRPLAIRLGEQARREIARRYSFDTMVASFEDLYASALGARAFPAADRVAAGI